MLLRNSQLRWGMLVRNSSGRGPVVVRNDTSSLRASVTLVKQRCAAGAAEQGAAVLRLRELLVHLSDLHLWARRGTAHPLRESDGRQIPEEFSPRAAAASGLRIRRPPVRILGAPLFHAGSPS